MDVVDVGFAVMMCPKCDARRCSTICCPETHTPNSSVHLPEIPTWHVKGIAP